MSALSYDDWKGEDDDSNDDTISAGDKEKINDDEYADVDPTDTSKWEQYMKRLNEDDDTDFATDGETDREEDDDDDDDDEEEEEDAKEESNKMQYGNDDDDDLISLITLNIDAEDEEEDRDRILKDNNDELDDNENQLPPEEEELDEYGERIVNYLPKDDGDEEFSTTDDENNGNQSSEEEDENLNEELDEFSEYSQDDENDFY